VTPGRDDVTLADPDGGEVGEDLEWRPPPAFDEYRVVRRLGGGTMGEVYLADDVLLDRRVAVKFVRGGQSASVAASERFYVEARAIARLQHPHVVAVYRVGRVRQRPYLVSEYVAGESLDRIELPLAAGRVVEIGVALASGLAAAHRRGVLHRDIKPANAIVSDAGDVKLLDFGLAKLLDENSAPRAGPNGGRPSRAAAPAQPDRGPVPTAGNAASATTMGGVAESPGRTLPGMLLGSPLYMAPEVWRGEPATAASDLYSLGVLLYELCAGRPPRHELSYNDLRRDVEAREVTPLGTVAPAVPAALASVIDRCLRHDPAARFATTDGLRRALDRLRDDAGAAAGPIATRDPYRGLDPFGAEHRALFYGRDDDARAVVGRLRAAAFVLVAGDSGVGKSSLCAAGVLPRVIDGGLGSLRADRPRPWSWVELVPGRRPLASLALALAPTLGTDEGALEARLREDPAEVSRELRRRLGADRGLVVYVDQLEELVTVSEPAEAALAAEALGDLALRAPNLRLLATARSDFLTRLTALPRLGAEVASALYLLAPLTGEGVRDAIVGPARAAGVEFESDALVEELARAVDGGGGLPLLQFALATLWEARERERGVVPASALAAIGSVGGALAGHADHILDRMLPPERVAARRVLLRLVTAEGTRVRRAAAELDSSPEGAAALEALVRGRLVVAREGEPDGAGTYELAHEVLLSAWGTLRAWMGGDLERRATRERLERAAREWDRLGQASDALWGPRQLAELDSIDIAELDPREAAFAAASRRARRRQQRSRRGLVIGAVAAVALTYAAVRIQHERVLATRVAAQLDAASLALEQAGALEREAGEARRRAFASFDAVPLGGAQVADAEAAWASQLERGADAARRYGEGERALETALLLDGTRTDVRRRFAELLYTRAHAAERDGQLLARDAYANRLALYDPDGAAGRRWAEPAHLAVVTTPPAARVDVARYAEDSRRKLGPFRSLGTTPLHDVALGPGSYLLTITPRGRDAIRYPIVLGRGESRRVSIEVPAVIPPGHVFVPAGRFLYGTSGDERLRVGFFRSQPLHPVETGSYFIARHEVTFGDWIDFLRALPAGERRRLIPGAADERGMVRLQEIAGGWRLTLQPEGPGGTTLEAVTGEPLYYPGRTRRKAQAWERIPVSGISWIDVVEYASWLDRTGRLPGARPCDEREWERAARGADDRVYPHGDVLAPDDANLDFTYGRLPGAYGPDEVGAHPASDSPFGVADLAGNIWEWARSMHSDEVIFRSGNFYRDDVTNQLVNRNFGTATMRNNQVGARMCADVPPTKHAKEP
jgi:serine/threonine protein kinase/formylglycine-generating enzyme required for sulfatase activity